MVVLVVKIIICAIFGIIAGSVVSLAITPIFCLLRLLFIVPFIRRGLLEKAEEEGHVIEATLQKYHQIHDNSTQFGPRASMKKMGTYNYQYNGKKYKYHMVSTEMPKTIKLYYIKKPRKATVADDLGNWEVPWIKFYLIISLLSALVSSVAFGIVWYQYK